MDVVHCEHKNKKGEISQIMKVFIRVLKTIAYFLGVIIGSALVASIASIIIVTLLVGLVKLVGVWILWVLGGGIVGYFVFTFGRLLYDGIKLDENMKKRKSNGMYRLHRMSRTWPIMKR